MLCVCARLGSWCLLCVVSTVQQADVARVRRVGGTQVRVCVPSCMWAVPLAMHSAPPHTPHVVLPPRARPQALQFIADVAALGASAAPGSNPVTAATTANARGVRGSIADAAYDFGRPAQPTITQSPNVVSRLYIGGNRLRDPAVTRGSGKSASASPEHQRRLRVASGPACTVAPALLGMLSACACEGTQTPSRPTHAGPWRRMAHDRCCSTSHSPSPRARTAKPASTATATRRVGVGAAVGGAVVAVCVVRATRRTLMVRQRPPS